MKFRKYRYLRAQAELSELLGILKCKTGAGMRLRSVLTHKNIILSLENNIFDKIRSGLSQNCTVHLPMPTSVAYVGMAGSDLEIQKILISPSSDRVERTAGYFKM